MSISSLVSKNVYVGDGATRVFPYTFPIVNTSDILVWTVDLAGNLTAYTSGYTVDTVGLTVTFPANPLNPALISGWQIVLLRVEPLTQNVALSNQGPNDFASINGALDKMTMICQQLQEQINRCVKFPVNSTTVAGSDATTFIGAVTAVLPPFSADTYANLKAIANAAPTVRRWGLDVITGQLYFYTGNTAQGDNGFVLVGG